MNLHTGLLPCTLVNNTAEHVGIITPYTGSGQPVGQAAQPITQPNTEAQVETPVETPVEVLVNEIERLEIIMRLGFPESTNIQEQANDPKAGTFQQGQGQSRDEGVMTMSSHEILPAQTRELQAQEEAQLRDELHLLERAGFPLETRIISVEKADKDPPATEQSKDASTPDLYYGDSEHLLDEYLRQVRQAFHAESYTEEEKCHYASNYLRGAAEEDWQKEVDLIEADPDRMFSFDGLVEILQKALVCNRTRRHADVVIKLGNLKQRPNQSVRGLIGYLEVLESQLPEYPNEAELRHNLIRSIHPHLRDALIRHQRLGGTRAELEEAVKSLEAEEPASLGLTVATTCHPKRGRCHPDERRSGDSTVKGAVKRRSRERRSGGPPPGRNLSGVDCQNCGKRHRQRLCPESRKAKTKEIRSIPARKQEPQIHHIFATVTLYLGGAMPKLRAIVGSGAYVNVLAHRKVKLLGLQGYNDVQIDLEDVAGNPIKTYQRHILSIGVVDSNNIEVIESQEFFGSDIDGGIDMILGMPWLHAFKPCINFSNSEFSY